MRVVYYNPPVVAALKVAPTGVRKAFYRQVRLHAKKYDEGLDLWQARVNKDWRFYFVINGDTCIVLDVIPHPK